MAVGLSDAAVQPYIEDVLRGCPRADPALVVACINSPRNTTISGDEDLVHELRAALDRDSVFARVLKVPVAYHSPHMLRMAQTFQDSIGIIEPGDAEYSSNAATMISSVTGKNIAKNTLQDNTYWVQNLVSSVRFSEAIGIICQNSTRKAPRKKIDLSHRVSVPLTDLLEVGPHSTLQGPIREISEDITSLASSTPRKGIAYHSMLKRGQSGVDTALEALGKLHCLGYNIDLPALNEILASQSPASQPLSLHSLPGYSFDHSKTYWEEPRVSKNIRMHSQPHNELIGLPCADWNPLEPRWRNTLKVSQLSWLADHKVCFFDPGLICNLQALSLTFSKIKGEILFPAAGMLAMAIEAVTQISSSQTVAGYEFRDVAILAPLVIPPDDSGVEVQLRLQPMNESSSKSSSWAAFSLFACRYDNFVEICRGQVKALDVSRIELETNTFRSDCFDALLAHSDVSGAVEVTGPELYGKLEESGYGYGPDFQGITTARRDGGGHAVGLVSMKRPSLPPACAFWQPVVVHPCLLDVMLQLSLPAVVRGSHVAGEAWIPTHISKLSLSRDGFESANGECNVQVRASTSSKGTRTCEAALQACDTAGRSAILRAEGVELTMVVDEQQAHREQQQQVKRLCYDMVLKPDVSLISMQSLVQYIGDSGAESDHANSFGPLQCFLDLKAHKNPGMRILQLGAGAGTATRQILQTLTMPTPNGPFCRFACYDCTAASSSMLETVSAELSGLPKLEFRVFDPQDDHEKQGFEDYSYDLVIAENVSDYYYNLQNFRQDPGYSWKCARSGMVIRCCRPVYPISESCCTGRQFKFFFPKVVPTDSFDS